jgi:hypothetical protein
MFTRRLGGVVGTAILCVGLAAQGALSQESPSAEGVVIPPSTTVLEGTPTVRIDSAEGSDTPSARPG